ncbi:MAG: 2-hydroxyacyl-CoA dehydratase [Dehalococcoidia bacterium]|nr:MAG: 2-hydroxyacyl-CoA dehydratase [Dehalococcoidia bacterium]
MSDKRLEKLIQERDVLDVMVKAFTQSPTADDKLSTDLAKVEIDHHNEIIRCAEEGKPFIFSYFACAPEIYTAMDLPWYSFLSLAFTGALSPTLKDDIDGSEKLFGKDLCTILRVAGYYIEEDLIPLPTAIIGLIHPCDGTTVLHQLIASNERWRHIPIFACDPPYFEDERSMDYYAGELKRMVSFLEEHTGHRLDMDRLREVIEESNKEYELWMEYNELRRAVPCPHGYGMGMQASGVAQSNLVGDPRGTAWFRDLVADAEKLVREKRGKVPNERIRLFWFDVVSLELSFDLFPWLEQEWGAVIVMDMFGYAPYTLIDTSSEESMFWGLSKRALCDIPMIRQARGVADNFLTDIRRVVKDYKIDCVVWPGHMGHKDGSANIGMMRETCRELGVPFLHIGMDLFDKRYTTVDEIKDKFSQFFTAMGLG